MVEHYQWLSSLEYEKFDGGLSEIEVKLRSYPVDYSCVVTNDYNSGYANITIVSNGEWYIMYAYIMLVMLE